MKSPYRVIDLFAGPGGLGEGFSGWENSTGANPFKISLSVEKSECAHKTLQFRAFYRQFPKGNAPKKYYDFLEGKLGNSADVLYQEPAFQRETNAAQKEARKFTLGEDNRAINKAIDEALGQDPTPWVLIGGPPCQAYSLAGRSRNKGIKDYRTEDDHRNFLYKEYLKVIARFKPAVFVMENVKGILSAKVGGVPIFDEIRRDLECPARALKTNDPRQEYSVFSLTTDSSESNDLFSSDLKPRDFIIHGERYGLP
jgi:DNA (cytosine-5)-methyltransferase 1